MCNTNIKCFKEEMSTEYTELYTIFKLSDVFSQKFQALGMHIH